MKIVKIEANVCPQCKALGFILMATPDINNEVEVVNIDKELPEFLKHYETMDNFINSFGIMGTPTLLFLDDNYDQELGRLVGAKGITPETIREAKVKAERGL